MADLDELVGAKEIADRLGLARPQVVYEWRRRHGDFPQPAVTLSMGSAWLWPDVQHWAENTGRLRPGRRTP